MPEKSVVFPQSTKPKLLEEPSLTTTLQGVYFIFYIFLPLHVLALAGHLQVEYTIILESYSQTHIKKTTAVFAKHIQ
jgi:hypothetical protein